MGLFDLFKKKENSEPPLKKRLATMKCKKVNYESTDFETLCTGMESGGEYLVSLRPANYYALKSEYIEAAFYSDEGHDENYVIFRLMKNDAAVQVSGIYPVSKETLRKAFSKLGAVNF